MFLIRILGNFSNIVMKLSGAGKMSCWYVSPVLKYTQSIQSVAISIAEISMTVLRTTATIESFGNCPIRRVDKDPHGSHHTKISFHDHTYHYNCLEINL